MDSLAATPPLAMCNKVPALDVVRTGVWLWAELSTWSISDGLRALGCCWLVRGKREILDVLSLTLNFYAVFLPVEAWKW